METVQESVQIMKLLCNEHRFAIMELLLRSPEGLCVNQIADHVGISQSLASHQLAYLQARGVILGIRHGQTICYEVHDTLLTNQIERVIDALA